MGTFWLVVLGMVAGAGAGVLAGLIGIGASIVIVPVVFYGLVEAGTSADQAAHRRGKIADPERRVCRARDNRSPPFSPARSVPRRRWSRGRRIEQTGPRRASFFAGSLAGQRQIETGPQRAGSWARVMHRR